MPKEVLNKATEYVLQVEQDWAKDKIKEYHDSKKALEGCGCGQCNGWHKRTEKSIVTEHYRLTTAPSIDHEELLLSYVALSKVKGPNED